MSRFFVELPLQAAGQELELPESAARHVQVLRHQPGEQLQLFDGRDDCSWRAEILSMGRRSVAVRLLAAEVVQAELPYVLGLACVMPANDRMDFLVEKATELGVGALQPLVAERSVLRLSGERADKKRAHWQGVAVAAAEQCGRVRVPAVAAVQALPAWLGALPSAAAGEQRWLASPGAAPPQQPVRGSRITLLSGPEGGLSAAEEALALQVGFQRIGLGPRILRADTAPLAVLAWLGLAAA